MKSTAVRAAVSWMAASLLLIAGGVHATEPRVIDVTLDSYSITPETITVKVGEPVTLKVTNIAKRIPHNLVIHAPEAGVDVKVDLSGGKSGSVSFTATKAGTYEVNCDKKLLFFESHKEKGMHGKLVVQP